MNNEVNVVSVMDEYQRSEVQFFSRRGLAISRMSRFGSSDLPKPSRTMMANTIDAKLLSNFTCHKQSKTHVT